MFSFTSCAVISITAFSITKKPTKNRKKPNWTVATLDLTWCCRVLHHWCLWGQSWSSGDISQCYDQQPCAISQRKVWEWCVWEGCTCLGGGQGQTVEIVSLSSVQIELGRWGNPALCQFLEANANCHAFQGIHLVYQAMARIIHEIQWGLTGKRAG